MPTKDKKDRKGAPSFFSNIGIGEEKDYFVENLAMLIASGMGIILALDAIRTEIKSSRMRRIIDAFKVDIEGGSPLWRALDETRLMPQHVISLIRIGEEAGKLSQNLNVIAEQQRKDRMFRSKLRSAMMYPALVLSVTVVIGTGIAWFILPRLSLVFAELELELPLITKILIATGTFLGDYGSIVMPIFLLMSAAAFYFAFAFPKTKELGQRALFLVPGIKKLILEVELARFGYVLGNLLDAGLPVVDALSSLAQATAFSTYRNLYMHLREKVEEGNSFKEGFAQYRKARVLVPTPIQQLIVTGEQSGHLSQTLLTIGRTFEERIDTTTKNLVVVLEPALLIIVWLGVVGVALAVILPIYSLIGGLQK